MMTEKNLEYYLSLPYTIQLIPYDDGTWFAEVAELPGCMTEADSWEEAGEMIREAMELWLEGALEDRLKIPEPKPFEIKEYSGKFLLRLPKSLHRELAERAEVESVSLNQWVLTCIARGLGSMDAEEKQSRASPASVAAD